MGDQFFLGFAAFLVMDFASSSLKVCGAGGEFFKSSSGITSEFSLLLFLFDSPS